LDLCHFISLWDDRFARRPARSNVVGLALEQVEAAAAAILYHHLEAAAAAGNLLAEQATRSGVRHLCGNVNPSNAVSDGNPLTDR
jgi:hypothetical protein